MADISADRHAPYPGFGTPSYRNYVLFVLVLVYVVNFIDRVALAYVQEPIKQEFQLNDLQLGLLGGPAFAVLYTLIGIPIARLAEHKSRIGILSVCIGIWSVMTAICGLATSFATLLAARVGVSVGEAGCTPPAQSLIGDYFPANKRATAISIYSLGVPVGTMMAGFGAGLLLTLFDNNWRTVFLAIGLPGLALALLARFTVKEPPRSQGAADVPTFGEALKILAKKPTFWHLTAGATLAAFVGYGVVGFTNSYLIRTYGLTPAQASPISAVIIGLFGGMGTFLCGFLADKMAHKFPYALAWLPVVGFLISTPLTILGFTVDSLPIAFVLLCAGSLSQYLYLGPQYAITQAIVPPRMRATSIAILLFVINIIGYGLGPPAIGILSDIFANGILEPQGLSVELCKTATDAQKAICATGTAQGLRHGLQVGVLVFLWAALHYGLAWRHMPKDVHR